jgi:hypothetical protein
MLNNMPVSRLVTWKSMRGNKKAKTKAKTILPLTDKENQQDDNQSRNNIIFYL